jgi:hypothetical protein
MELAVVCGFGLLAAVQSGLTSDLATRFYAGPDPMQDVWVLHWVTSHLHRPFELFEGNNYFPSRHALLYCDPLIGPGVLVWPARLLTTNPVLLYNLAIVAAFTATGYGTYRLALHLWGSRSAAVLAGVLVAHAPPLLAHRAHLNLIAIGGLPVIVLGLVKLLDRPTVPVAVATGVVLALQALTSGYYALIGAMLASAICTLKWRSFRDPRVAGSIAIVAAIASVLVIPYVTGFLHLSREETSTARVLAEARHYSVHLPESFLRTKSIVWQHVFGAVYEEPMWPGLTLLVFAPLGLVRAERYTRLLTAVAALFFVLALGPELTVFGTRLMPLPFAAVRGWPFLSAVKHPSSFMVPVWIVGGVIAARGLARWTGQGSSRWARVAVIAFALVETLHPAPPRTARALEASPAHGLLDRYGAGAVLELPCEITTDSEWQWASIVHGRRIVNGKGAFCPDSYNRLHRIIRTEWNTESLRPLTETPSFGFFLARFPIRYVIVHAGTPGRIVRNIEATPEHFALLGEVADGAKVFRLRNGGRGRELRRWLRDDQLHAPIRITARGTPSARLTVTLHAHDAGAAVLGERTLTGAREVLEWRIPRSLVRVGLNNIQWSVDRDILELEDVEWAEPPDVRGK